MYINASKKSNKLCLKVCQFVQNIESGILKSIYLRLRFISATSMISS